MSKAAQRHHVKLIQLLKTPQGQVIPVAARIESYAEGEEPQILWSTMPVVETVIDLIHIDILKIVREINDNIDAVLTEFERDGWYIEAEAEQNQEQGKALIYRTTHFILRRRDDDVG
jgi:hypothetical protein